MNDFTKEELGYIVESVTPDDSGGWHREPDIAYRLIDKLQSMIDNYCNCIDTEEFTDTIIKCTKCCKIKGYGHE